VLVAVAAAVVALGGTPSCRAPEIRQHDEVVFGHFSTRAAALRVAKRARHVGFVGLKIENEGCGDFEVELDGADTEQQRAGVSREAAKAGFQVTFEQTGEPMDPPKGQTVGIFASKPTVDQANALAQKLAVLNFRYTDIVPLGRRWLIVLPQVPIKNALPIAHEVATAGYHIQFRLPQN
jgi:hypothetical protein